MLTVPSLVKFVSVGLTRHCDNSGGGGEVAQLYIPVCENAL